MKNYVFFIDDTKPNSQNITSDVLKEEYVSYCGILVEEKQLKSVEYVMNGMCDELFKNYKTKELHFTDIYNGNKEFKSMSANEKLDLIGAMVELVKYFDIKIFTSTFNTTTEKQIAPYENLFKLAFKEIQTTRNPKTVGWLLAIYRANGYVKMNLKNSQISKVICDEGIRKPGSKIKLPLTTNKNGLDVEFDSPENNPVLQIADFAAWALTRTKLILDKNQKSQMDKELLPILSDMSENYVNLEQKEINLNDKLSYDEIIKK